MPLQKTLTMLAWSRLARAPSPRTIMEEFMNRNRFMCIMLALVEVELVDQSPGGSAASTAPSPHDGQATSTAGDDGEAEPTPRSPFIPCTLRGLGLELFLQE